MITMISISAALGAALGIWLGWKAGRGYERMRPARPKKDEKSSK